MTAHTDHGLNIYVVDDSVVFYERSGIVTSLLEEKSARLQGKGKACFALLLRTPGCLVSWELLMQTVWPETRGHVSNNTIYQTILNLRRALESLVPEKQYIVTIKGQGLMVPEAFTVSPVSAEAAAILPFQPQPEPENVSLADVPINAIEETVVISEENASEEKNGVSQWLWRFRYTILGGIAAIVVGLAAFYFFQLQSHNYMAQKKRMATVGDCIVYASPDYHDYPDIQKLVENGAAECKKSPYVYVFRYNNVPRATLFYCRKQVSVFRENECYSKSFIRNAR
jgi:DNA-binding winged helix-turn-helix (wHTH) protein